MTSNFNEEKKLWKQGYKFVVGLDESGRGPLAGPVVACAVMIEPEHLLRQGARRSAKIFKKSFRLRDSKKLNKNQREKMHKLLTTHPSIKWGVGIVSEIVIDRINILEATKLAMKNAILDFKKNMGSILYYNPSNILKKFTKIDFLLIDGNFALNNLSIPQKSIIRADEKVFSCVAAGIIAKVTRDNIMKALHGRYPKYGFDKHKGYGTKLHMKNLQNFGPCKIHRKTFFPVSALAKREIS